ncbi:phospholipase D-like domain-containing protein [Gryllotalpicola protaetiae]|uniref:phospholipase D-like domain-containing protein n=1 Tax=Gryllotalpicola protaetiae TaxID=2419771 RepID=UPI0013C4A51E|nr:phospholipase D-like domain-containing protein [Gryllotalpicola protaetiae]
MTDTTPFPPISALIARRLDTFKLPGVLSVRPGFQLVDGWVTATPAIVVTVEAERPPGLPSEVGGFPIDVRVASPRKRTALLEPARFAASGAAAPDEGKVPEFADEVVVAARPAEASVAPSPDVVTDAAKKPQLPYSPPVGVPLSPVSGELTVQLAASPDAGWEQLSAFLDATESELVIGLYDFTSAHVLAAFEKAAAGKKVTLTLDHPSKNPTADQTDEQTVAALKKALGAEFEQAWALSGMDPKATVTVFQTAYHIKVAAQDSTAVWVSSGNWNNSNQPAIDPVNVKADAEAARSGDRDWHVVVRSPELTTTFAAYLAHDFDVASQHNQTSAAVMQPELLQPAVKTPPFAQFFAATTITDQMTITPVLTPDTGVYVDAVKSLITSATKTLHLQFQYIELPKTTDATNQAFVDLVAAVIDRQKVGVEVRIIMSEYETAGYLEQLQAAGLDVANNVKLQNNVHNKGVIVDGRAALVSSQNWSSAGALRNRDAGVIIENTQVAEYFEQLFEHDWEHLAAKQVAED